MYKIEDLREALAQTIKGLQDVNNPLEIERAKAISEVAKVMVESAKAETAHLKVVGGISGTSFIPDAPRLEDRKK